jgi:hypothetical protein
VRTGWTTDLRHLMLDDVQVQGGQIDHLVALPSLGGHAVQGRTTPGTLRGAVSDDLIRGGGQAQRVPGMARLTTGRPARARPLAARARRFLEAVGRRRLMGVVGGAGETRLKVLHLGGEGGDRLLLRGEAGKERFDQADHSVRALGIDGADLILSERHNSYPQ